MKSRPQTPVLLNEICRASKETYVKATKRDKFFSGHQPRQFKDEYYLEVKKHAYDPLTLPPLRLADSKGT
jgi:hypothetical protein